MLEGPIGLPQTANESLIKKPRAQTQFTALVDATSPLSTVDMQLKYLNFYGNLLKKVDSDLVR